MHDDFEQYLRYPWPRLVRSAWLLTGDWQRAEELKHPGHGAADL